MKSLLLTVIALASLGTACATASEDQLRARAAFDFQCDKTQFQVLELDSSSRAVRGCGQQAVYVEACVSSSRCTWKLDTIVNRAPSPDVIPPRLH